MKALTSWLIAAMLIFGLACGASSLHRATTFEAALQGAGMTPWPGNDAGDDVALWQVRTDRTLRLVGADAPDLAASLFPVGFSVWMALAAWGLRDTWAPLLFLAGSLGFGVLVTGGIGAADPVPAGMMFDAARGTYDDGDGHAGLLCDLDGVRVTRRGGGRGGPDYWVTLRPVAAPVFDLSVFGTERSARLLAAQIDALREQAACGPSR